MKDTRTNKFLPAYDPVQEGYFQAGTAYQELFLSTDCRLGRYVSEFFEVRESDESQVLRVIPDGCNDLIITFDGGRISSYISPSVLETCQFHFQKKEWIFGVRFRPGATCFFFRDILKYDSIQAVEAEAVMTDMKDIIGMLSESRSFARRYEIVSSYLSGKICGFDGIGELIGYCVNSILADNGSRSVEELAGKTGYSDRYLRQLFKQYVGHSPKALASIVRTQRVIQYLRKHPEVPLTQVALQFGFADQSHMNRDFHRYIRLTSGCVRSDENWLGQIHTERTRSFG